MSYSVTSSADACYPGTTVLVNKLGLRNQEALNEAESVTVALHSAAIEAEEVNSRIPFSFDYYCGLHRRLFGDLYDWAGELRTIDFSKKGTVFYKADVLRELGTAKFARLEAMDEFKGLPRSELVDSLTDLYHELNMLHPFREGNGRTQRLFFTLLLQRLGYRFSFAECDTDELTVIWWRCNNTVNTFIRNIPQSIFGITAEKCPISFI